MRGDSDLERMLHRSRFQRIVLAWLVFLAFMFLGYLALQLQADGVAACERGTEAARERAEVARRVGAFELERKALLRAGLDCGEAYSWF